MSSTSIIVIDRDTTVLLPCRRGDFLLWIRSKGFLADPADPLTIPDYWELHDGDSVMITNRLPDLPTWFELHPTEMVRRIHDVVDVVVWLGVRGEFARVGSTSGGFNQVSCSLGWGAASRLSCVPSGNPCDLRAARVRPRGGRFDAGSRDALGGLWRSPQRRWIQGTWPDVRPRWRRCGGSGYRT
jgi:hypothetical protein